MRARIAACLLLASFSPCAADPAPTFHYAPAGNLEHVDVASIDRAEHEIDMAAYVLSDWAVMQATQHSARSFKMPRCLALGSQFIAMPARYRFFSLLPTLCGSSAPEFK